jgi:hypothetical protein
LIERERANEKKKKKKKGADQNAQKPATQVQIVAREERNKAGNKDRQR